MDKFIGYIALKADVPLVVADPCQGVYVEIKRFLPGEWECEFTLDEDRVVSSCISAKDAWNNLDGAPEYVGAIGVESGFAGFYSFNPNYDDDAWSDFCDRFYRTEAKTGLSAMIDNTGFTTASGLGDGWYPVYVRRNRSGHIVVVEIIFEDDD